MNRYIILSIFLIIALYISPSLLAQRFTVSGTVVNNKKNTPVEFAIVSLSGNDLWGSTNEKGEFIIKNVPIGKTSITVYCLGYEKNISEIFVLSSETDHKIRLLEDNLALNEVVITAKEGKDIGASYVIDRHALDHLQMLNVTDVSSLLPGGKTNRILHLATPQPQRFFVSGASGERGNATFGVALEVDGVRQSNNAGYDLNSNNRLEIGGSDTRNIQSSNIESIEIITGIPSVEHGDMTNGMVKINTRKGSSPYIIELATKPNTKQIAINKGFALGSKVGVLNFSIEHTKSIADLASPHTSYDRNGLSLTYSNTLNRKRNQPILLNVGVSGNIGGYDSSSDPDLFVNTYEKKRDNAFKTNFSIKWLLNKTWITNIETSGAINYADKLTEQSVNQSVTSSIASIRTTEMGYHVGQLYDDNPNADIVLIPRGYWYQLYYRDNKPLSYSSRLKGNLTHSYKQLTNNIMIGGEFNGSGNKGRGVYYDDMRFAPTWREYRYDKEPYMNNYAIYGEDKVSMKFHKSELQIVAGVRSELTSIRGSEYGIVSNLSPRFNTKYMFNESSGNTIKDLAISLGWGKTVKLPSFVALYPIPYYRDIRTFAPGTTTDGTAYYAYHTMPSAPIHNKDLKWQSNIQTTFGVDFKVKGIKISLTATSDKTHDPYIQSTVYTPFTYNFTDETALNGSMIPIENRDYIIDKNTGIVTVIDKSGIHNNETLVHKERLESIPNTGYINGSSIERKTFRWVMDFGKVAALQTSFVWDGSYYYYRGVEQTLRASTSAVRMADGNPYKYIGFYVGTSSSSNGDVSKELNSNVTVTTHIPAIKMIVSLRVEAALYQYSQRLSESSMGNRGFVIDNKDSYFPSTTDTNIYGGDKYVALYPEYYVSLDDMDTKIPFAEKFLWARDNDTVLYNELSKLVSRVGQKQFFKEDNISPYFSANISVTKEIGSFASISFNATNFVNTLSKVYSKQSSTDASLHGSRFIPRFYYGLSLRLKL